MVVSRGSGKPSRLVGGGAIDHEARGVDLRRHVGDLPLDALELLDRPPELVALLDERERALVGGLRQADADRGVADALGAEPGHQRAEAVRRRGIAGHQHVLLRHAHAVEAQVALGRAAPAHLGIRARRRDPRRARVDDQRADPLRAASRRAWWLPRPPRLDSGAEDGAPNRANTSVCVHCAPSVV